MRLLSRIALLFCIFFAAPWLVHAQDVRVSNMNCDFNFNGAHVVSLEHAISFIQQAGFPKDWRIIIACNEKDWERIRDGAKLTPYHSKMAFTSLKKRTTAVNAAVFDAVYSMGYSPMTVLHHEVGHIRCQCSDEDEADRQGHTHISADTHPLTKPS